MTTNLNQQIIAMRNQLPIRLIHEMVGSRIETTKPVSVQCPHRVAWLDDASPQNICRDCGAPLERPPMVMAA